VSDLVEFLTARLDEDEAWANDRAYIWATEWSCIQDPARVLREVDAKRKILAEYQAVLDDARGVGESSRRPRLYGRYDGLDHALKALAAVWSGHPDYDPDWA
jgi:hypothetical protein